MHLDSFDLDIQSLPLIKRGKVRDIYAAGSNRLLIVASDRLSAFDVILPTPMPGKGQALTEISNFWFDLTANQVANHCLGDFIEPLLSTEEYARVATRASLVKRLDPLPIEAVVRGYLVGSGWQDYQGSGRVCGQALPPNLEQASQLTEALYTPATKAAIGEHDENIDFATSVNLVGAELAEQIRATSLSLYALAAEYALKKGIIIADTKFEFGLDEEGQLVLMDELLTPDSSRFWDINEYRVGANPPSFDKQIIRDYLETLNWNKKPPAPTLPQTVIDKTLARYHQALSLLKS